MVCGLLTRWWVLSTAWGTLNSDEAVTGLGAIDAIHGRFDVVIPGNAYTANLESYLFAPIVAMFGAHVTPLKLLPVALWAVACLVVGRLTSRVHSDVAGVVAGSLLWLVPGALLVLSTRAYLAYSGGLLLVATSLYCLSAVLGREVPSARSSAVAGCLVGLAVFAHPMYLAVVGPACVVVGVYHRRHWRRWWAPAGGAALLVNMPWIVWNARHGFPSLGGEVVGDSRGTYLQRLARFFSGLLPRDLGLLDQAGSRWTLGKPVSVSVYLVAIGIVLIGGRCLFRSSRSGRLVAVCLVAVWPAMALFSPLGFVTDGRYGVVPAAVLFPAFAVGVVQIAGWVAQRRPSLETWTSLGVIAAWVGLLVVPYQQRNIGRHFGDPNAPTSGLIDFLDANEVRYIAGSYWAVLPVTYMSDTRIPSAVTSGYPIRYPHYQRLVEAAPAANVAFVFLSYDENPGALLQPVGDYDRVEVAGFIVYLPKASA